jgi:peptidoglycan-associated lipoprotein
MRFIEYHACIDIKRICKYKIIRQKNKALLNKSGEKKIKGDQMKKVIIFSVAFLMVFAALSACRGRAPVEEVTPPPAPPPPEVKEQPKVETVEKVEEPAMVKEPELTEEEIFMNKTLEEINLEAPLQMIHFDYDKYFIRDDAKPLLEENAEWLKKYDTAVILIEGHCDERGTEEYNLALGEKRAKSTLDYLASLGISQDRIRTISYGKSMPLDPGHNEISWQKNRRAQFLIIKK